MHVKDGQKQVRMTRLAQIAVILHLKRTHLKI
uniref:Uncharacterized protein n=1 Tax=Cucumis melo TaxID=3656 RepID=A0A9I9DT88_CUCME